VLTPPLLFFISRFLFSVAGVASIIYGALGGLVQTKLKRFLGYTSINQMGFVFLGLSCGTLDGLAASFLYLLFYIAMNFSFFSILLQLKNLKTQKGIVYINELRFLGVQPKQRFLALFFALLLFSMAGMPPLMGFFGKLFLFLALFKSGSFFVSAVVLVVNTVSAFYYLRLIRSVFFGAGRRIGSGGTYFYSGHSCLKVLYSLNSIVCLLFLLLTPFWLDSYYLQTLELAQCCILIALPLNILCPL
jgi:NADH:ubiquinone oxidoreductase subunit 2 (subunit N)